MRSRALRAGDARTVRLLGDRVRLQADRGRREGGAGQDRLAVRRPDAPYSTDEDAVGTYSALSIDPLANQYDQSDDPLAYFKQRPAGERAVGIDGDPPGQEGEGYQDHAAGAGSRPQRRLSLARDLVQDDRRDLSPSRSRRRSERTQPVHAGARGEAARSARLPRHLRVRREGLPFVAEPDEQARRRAAPGLDPAYFQIQRLDYPWHDNVLRIQKAVLDRLYNSITLARIQDSELRFAANERAFRMADLFSGLNTAIWSELDGGAGEITSLRRNLQREQLKQLIRLTLRQPTAVAAQGFGTPLPAPIPEDATTLARASLLRIQSKIKTKLAGRAPWKPPPRRTCRRPAHGSRPRSARRWSSAPTDLEHRPLECRTEPVSATRTRAPARFREPPAPPRRDRPRRNAGGIHASRASRDAIARLRSSRGLVQAPSPLRPPHHGPSVPIDRRREEHPVIAATQLKVGMVIMHNGKPHRVTHVLHVTPGTGGEWSRPGS